MYNLALKAVKQRNVHGRAVEKILMKIIEEFHKINDGIDAQALENKLFYLLSPRDSHQIQSNYP
jgi:hypothetical protein